MALHCERAETAHALRTVRTRPHVLPGIVLRFLVMDLVEVYRPRVSALTAARRASCQTASNLAVSTSLSPVAPAAALPLALVSSLAQRVSLLRLTVYVEST